MRHEEVIELVNEPGRAVSATAVAQHDLRPGDGRGTAA
jgi:hypothetical protein